MAERPRKSRALAGVTRRALLSAAGGLTAAGLLAGPRRAAAALLAVRKATRRPGRGPRVVVVGAGAFGGWSALFLLRGGARVTLVDAWGPGNSRASSGGETRVIRGVYGPERIYTRMAARAFTLWREAEARWKKKLYRRTGALWMVADEGDFVRASLPILRENGFAYDELTAAQAGKRYPQIDLEGIRWALFEKEAGYLAARHSCADVVDGFVSEGGEYREAAVEPGPIAQGRMDGIRLSDGASLEADAYVFACGPWLPRVFPDLLGKLVAPTRQEVFFFGTPSGDDRFSEARFPVWVEVPRFFYGIPGNERRGFKIADDARGAAFDPTDGDRRPSSEALESARRYITRRFPALRDAPLLESRVCQYENSPDHHFLVDRHPAAHNLWIVGGGSGHGFKHGPALGELVAGNVLGRRPAEKLFSLARFQPQRGQG